jgi:hypothetical protein
MVASVEPTPPPHRPPVAGQDNLFGRRVSASLPTFGPGNPHLPRPTPKADLRTGVRHIPRPIVVGAILPVRCW